MRKLHIPFPARAARQRGLTLVEFMVSVAIGMILVAALATLIADQSSNRAEVDRAGRLVESGRYAARVIADDLQMAGYWGEISTAPAAPAAWADPCGAGPAYERAQADVVADFGQHVAGFEIPGTGNGYNGAATLPAGVDLGCLTNRKAGTDVVVVRHADADSSPYDAAPGVPNLAKLTGDNPKRLFVQSGMNPANGLFTWKAEIGANAAAFDLTRKDKVTLATVRKVVMRMYYVTTCSVCTGTADSIPSLKMKELVEAAAPGQFTWSNPITISEGIENLQVEYGVDTDLPAAVPPAPRDGAPDADFAGSAVGVADWPAVVTAKLYVLARSIDPTPGYTDEKTYPLGMAGTVAAANDRFKRHVFVHSVRLVNPSFRRSL